VVGEVKYALKELGRLMGRAYDRYRHEIEVAYAAGAETAPLLRDAARLGPRTFEGRLAKLDAYLEETEPGTPYREAVLAVRRQLDAARRGEIIPTAQSPPVAAVGLRPGPGVGPPAPDFRAGDFRLTAARGKPVVLVFFMPGKETTDLSLAVADALQERYAGRLAVVPLAVFASREAGIRDRDRLKLTVPIHDGAAAGVAYGVETFPRFVVIDPAGAVRWMFAGVGAETGFLVREQVDALLAPPPGPAATTGTTYPPDTRVPPVAPRR
jgi:hypothetical protein